MDKSRPSHSQKDGYHCNKSKTDELIPTRIQYACIDYQKSNSINRKDHFSLPFLDQMLERLAKCVL